MRGLSQNRINSWEIDKITSIQVDFKAAGDEERIELFTDENGINEIISFLKSVEFKDLKNSNIDIQGERNNWIYKIFFQGQRDQVFLFKDFAFIGRTCYLIDNKVIEDFGELIDG
jgi:hypothetical protein